MATPDLETVQSALMPIGSVLTRAFRRAWQDWQAAGLTHWRPRGRANFIWEQAAHYTVIDVEQLPGISVILKNESYHFLVDGTVSFRLKKADSSGFTQNYPTQEALAFHDPQLPLTGVPAEHRVEVTYTLNKTATDIYDIAVVAREGDRVAWTYSLLDSDSVASLPVRQENAPPSLSDRSIPTGLVRSKGKKNTPDKAGDVGEQ
jgi:hypothetical protein